MGALRRLLSPTIALSDGCSLPFPKLRRFLCNDSEQRMPLAPSLVKIFSNFPKISSSGPPENATGSGFVIRDRRIITSSQLLADGEQFVFVEKQHCSFRYKARIVGVGGDVNLALLLVDSDNFWEGMSPVDFFDELPWPIAVHLVGYPDGLLMKKVSVTKHIVTRLKYEMDYCPNIYGAVDLGLVGAPALLGEEVVGVVSFRELMIPSSGHLIPVDEVLDFIQVYEDVMNADLVRALSLLYHKTERKTLGVRITDVDPFSETFTKLRDDDIIIGLDGLQVAGDGTVSYLGEHVTLDNYITLRELDKVEVKARRTGKEFRVFLRPYRLYFPLKLWILRNTRFRLRYRAVSWLKDCPPKEKKRNFNSQKPGKRELIRYMDSQHCDFLKRGFIKPNAEERMNEHALISLSDLGLVFD